MSIVEAFANVQKSLDELQRVIEAFDITPQIVELDTRIKALTGQLIAKIEQPE